MKKIILSIIVICCLLISSIVSVNAFDIQTKNEKTKMIFNERNPLRNILDKKDYFNAINRDDIQYSGNPLLTGFDGDIIHAYFNTWAEQYSDGWGYKSIINDGYLYQAIQKNPPICDEWLGIVKYNASDGSLCDFEVYYDSVANCAKKDMVIIDNYIYIAGLNDIIGYSFIVKYNISGDSITFENSLTMPYYRWLGWNICADSNFIYICGDDETNDSLLLQKYNTDLEPIWSEPKTWNGPYGDDECEYMTFYDGSIFVTGSTGNGDGYTSFVLKFDSNGNLLEEIIGLNDDQSGLAIKGYNGKIYVAYRCRDGLLGLNFNALVSAYDTDLVNLWTSEPYDYCYVEYVEDMVIVDDYIYMGGTVFGIDWWNSMTIYSKGFILKVDISNGEKIWWKTVDAPGTKPWTTAVGICADESYLYLSGVYDENWFDEEGYSKAYILKCDFNGNPSSVLPNVPEISGSNSGEINVEYDYTFISTMNSNPVHLQYYIDWGDGSHNTTDFYPSGQEVIVSHTWTERGSYAIMAKAITIDGYESDWGTLEVRMPVSKTSSQPGEQSMPLGTQGSSSPTNN